MTDQPGHEPPRDPQDLERLLVDRQWVGDIDGMVALFEHDAVIDNGEAELIRGQEAIRTLFEAFAANGHNACVMSQTLASQKLKKTISVLSIGRDRTGKLTGSLRMPIGVSLPAGVVVGVENRDPFNVPYTACHRVGCFAPFNVTEPLLGQMQKATKITVVAQSVSKQALNLNFSTRGFSDAYAAYVTKSK